MILLIGSLIANVPVAVCWPNIQTQYEGFIAHAAVFKQLTKGILMKTKLITAVVATALIGLAGCEVDKTSSGEMPSVDVDVSADSGKLPSYDVDWANVDVGTRTEMVTVPTVVIAMEEVEVEVPYMDVNMPNETGEKTKRTIVVEAEVKDRMHNLEIQHVFAKQRRLLVVSSLTPTDQSLDDKTVRVSDRIVLNAPDLDVEHIIIGKKPNGDWNNQYTFIANKAALSSRTEGAQEIYTR